MTTAAEARKVFWTILLLGIVAITGCTSVGVQLEQKITAYKRQPSQKAFAVGYYPNGFWVAGWNWGQLSLEIAKEEALRGCEEKAAMQGAPISCRIIYENDVFIAPATIADAEPKPDPADPRSRPPANAGSGTGSGVFISADGLILTAEHVIRGATNIEVLTQDGRRLSARVKSASRSLDLAVLATTANSTAFVPVCLTKPTTGARVFTVGFPLPGVLGQEPKVSDGIINAASGITDDAGFMQISIPIQPGNSGGPVVTEDGFLVGIVTSSAAIAPFLERTGTIPQNVNWAAHSSLAVTLLGKEGVSMPPRSRDESIAYTIRAAVLVIAQSD